MEYNLYLAVIARSPRIHPWVSHGLCRVHELGRLGHLIRNRNRFIVPCSFLAPPLYADGGERNVQLSTGMRFFDGSGTFSSSIRYISHIMTIYTLKEIR